MTKLYEADSTRYNQDGSEGELGFGVPLSITHDGVKGRICPGLAIPNKDFSHD